MTTNFDALDTLAAMALRDAVEQAIRGLESEIKREPAKGLRPEAEKYFERQHADQMKAIDQLRRLRGVAHKRVFDSQAATPQ